MYVYVGNGMYVNQKNKFIISQEHSFDNFSFK